MLLSFSSSDPMAYNDNSSLVPSPEDEEQLIDYGSSPECMDLEDY
jgi:hypothetical protein